ncbi:hypothetical protein [Neobacillus sp. D3-1R]|uniref:hypothetical protein n=1 Tax=Neobacillus sp. D3-1R TaxID=3445778 RepID=UPI003FA19040
MYLVVLYLASIVAGYALSKLPSVDFLSGLGNIFNAISALSMIVFSLAILYMGVKALIKKS